MMMMELFQTIIFNMLVFLAFIYGSSALCAPLCILKNKCITCLKTFSKLKIHGITGKINTNEQSLQFLTFRMFHSEGRRTDLLEILDGVDKRTVSGMNFGNLVCVTFIPQVSFCSRTDD